MVPVWYLALFRLLYGMGCTAGLILFFLVSFVKVFILEHFVNMFYRT